jgi:hypothetical protein
VKHKSKDKGALKRMHKRLYKKQGEHLIKVLIHAPHMNQDSDTITETAPSSIYKRRRMNSFTIKGKERTQKTRNSSDTPDMHAIHGDQSVDNLSSKAFSRLRIVKI